jgi:hypothetical protein
MSAWELWTWVSIVILIGGSLAIFAWFLVDALRWLRRDGTAARHAERRPTDGEPPSER